MKTAITSGYVRFMTKQSTSHNAIPRVDVIGVPISAVTMESALTYIAREFEALRGSYICAANVHTTVMARENPDYYQVQAQSALALPDGKPLSVVGRRKTELPMEKVTGTHFLQHIFTDPRFAGKRHFFYGTDPRTLEKMMANIAVDYPELLVCGFEPSVFRPLSDQEVEALARRISLTEADFIWVAIGAPRQEFLMHRLRGKVTGLMTGVGGAFKILAGDIDDAPLWMQNAGLEWFYRLCREPGRLLKRYLVTNTKFIFYLLSDR